MFQHTSQESTGDTQKLFRSGYGTIRPLLSVANINDSGLYSNHGSQSEARTLGGTLGPAKTWEWVPGVLTVQILEMVMPTDQAAAGLGLPLSALSTIMDIL